MEKQIFKVGDKVFHIEYGWGVIENINGSYYYITFSTYGTRINCEHNILSFTEYTLQGFTQERPIELPEVGELCLFRNFDVDDWLVRKFNSLSSHPERKYITTENKAYRQLKRIKILD